MVLAALIQFIYYFYMYFSIFIGNLHFRKDKPNKKYWLSDKVRIMSESGEGGGEKEKKPKPALVRLKNKTSSGGGSLSSPLASGGNKLGGGRALGVTPLNRSGSGGGGGASLFSSPNRTSGLQSFKPKRDLTLGSSGVKGVAGSPAAITPLKSVTSASTAAPKSLERKKFVPNLNVTRQIKKENNADAASHATNGGGGKRRRDNNKFERREKNSRDRPALIQTDSIFSEGNNTPYLKGIHIHESEASQISL